MNRWPHHTLLRLLKAQTWNITGTTINNEAHCDPYENHLKLLIISKRAVSSVLVYCYNITRDYTYLKQQLKYLPHPAYLLSFTPRKYRVSGLSRWGKVQQRQWDMHFTGGHCQSKYFFFLRDLGIDEVVAALLWTWWGLCWKAAIRGFSVLLWKLC